jgi:hypothetical protein
LGDLTPGYNSITARIIYFGSEMYDLSWIVNLGKPYSWSLQTSFPQYSRNGKIAQSEY